MFYKNEEKGYSQVIEGVRIKTLVHGTNTLTAKFILDKGSALPSHSHPHEQTGYLISGKMRFNIDGTSYLAEEGDSWCIGGEVEHSVEVLEDSVAIEIFSPLREDYLPERLQR